MIVGSGLLARAFERHAESLEGVCVYAAGVSNSACVDRAEFERDRSRLQQVLADLPEAMRFVYFSTCSVCDPWVRDSPYARHKLEVEEIVRGHSDHIIVRLPQLAGNTPNPHTLLNYLYNRIVRSERFDLWRHATRNIIDVADAADVVIDLMRNTSMRADTVNVANSRNATLREIVAALEAATGRAAVYNVIDRGGDFRIDVSRIADSLQRCNVNFDDAYLSRTISRHYGRRA